MNEHELKRAMDKATRNGDAIKVAELRHKLNILNARELLDAAEKQRHMAEDWLAEEADFVPLTPEAAGVFLDILQKYGARLAECAEPYWSLRFAFSYFHITAISGQNGSIDHVLPGLSEAVEAADLELQK